MNNLFSSLCRTTLVVLLLLIPGTTMAETVVRTSETVTITADQRVESDFYAAATAISQSGTIAGDMYAVGGTITINGSVEADVTAVSGRASLTGPIADDVRVIAGEVEITDAVGGDVFVIGGTLRVLSTATIAGDVYIFGGDADIEGSVGGSILGHAERIRVDAPVGGDIEVTARQGLTLGARAQVAGNVSFQSSRELVRAPEAVVSGSVIRNTTPLMEQESTLADYVLSLLIMLFGSLVLYLLARSVMSAVVTQVRLHPFRSALLGFAALITGPFVAILLMSTILGLVIGLSTVGAYILVLALSYSIAPMVLGVIIWQLFGGQPVLQPFAILLGVCVLQALLLIPAIGGIVLVALSICAAGALATVLFRRVSHG